MNQRMLLFGAPLLLLLLLAIFSEHDTIVLGQNTSIEPIAELLAFFESDTDEYELIIQSSMPIGAFSTDREFQQLERRTMEALRTMNHDASHIHAEISITKLDEHRQAWLSIKLRIDHTQSTNTHEVSTLIHHFNVQLAPLQIKPFWTYTIQGELKHESNLTENVFERIMGHWKAEQTGAYEDGGSMSVSFESPVFAALAPYSGSDTGNVQVAIHQHSETGNSRLTVGIPAIQIEY